MNLRRLLERRLQEAFAAAGLGEAPVLLAASARPQFGDYQANGIMAAAKQAKANPRHLAEMVLAKADLADLAEKVEVAGPGFINITLSDAFLTGRARAAAADDRLAVPAAQHPQRVVVDYSCPNLAKEMHVGHLRSTIIGDALARVLGFLGHEVIRQNHVGDWGTQFGMLTAHLVELRESGQETQTAAELADLEEFYRQAKQRFDADTDFAGRARRNVVRLQSGDAEMLGLWRQFVAESLRHCQDIYDRLGVLLSPSDVRGESAYNNDLPRVVADLDAAGLLTESQGARCVFLDEFTNKDGEPLPVIVQKSDGGYLYATTDLAAIRYRAAALRADRVLYVTDSRQALHFAQVFEVARRAGFAPAGMSLEHIPFGTMMGSDGKPFKTRTGGTVKLRELLDEAVAKARQLVADKNPDLADADEVARAVGIGAVKYADLAHNRASDYVFSWEKMLSLDGNTAPYMQYACARIRSIFRKGAEAEGDAIEAAAADEGDVQEDNAQAAGAAEPCRPGDIVIAAPAERALALRLAQLPETVEAVAAECLPHLLCAYLYDLAGAFMAFYESCTVLKAEPATRRSRLALCRLTAGAIDRGLGLLGIETLEQM